MIIPINEDFRIATDPHNFIIEEKRVRGKKSKNAGEVTWGQLSFHPNLQQAIDSYSRRYMRDSDATTLGAVLASLGTLQAEIQGVKKLLPQDCDGEVR